VAIDGKSKHTSNQSNYKMENAYKTLLNNTSISLRTRLVVAVDGKSKHTQAIKAYIASIDLHT
jgi:hypothetical protein